MNILIAGYGYLGSYFASLVIGDGAKVFAISRTPKNLPDGCRAIHTNLANPTGLEVLPTTVDCLVFAAAPTSHELADYKAVYLDGAKGILGGLKNAEKELKHIIFTSSTGVYGQDDGSVVDEDSPTNPTSETGQVLLEAESVFINSGIPTTIIRFGGIYGPGRDRMVRGVLSGSITTVNANHFTNRMHVKDCARCIQHLISTPGIFIGVDDEPSLQSEVVEWIARVSGVSLPAIQQASPLRSRGNKRCSNRKLKSTGFKLLCPTYRDGYKELL